MHFLQNGNVGFMLSCYDAQLSYDSGTDTFQARYNKNGGQAFFGFINFPLVLEVLQAKLLMLRIQTENRYMCA